MAYVIRRKGIGQLIPDSITQSLTGGCSNLLESPDPNTGVCSTSPLSVTLTVLVAYLAMVALTGPKKRGRR